MKYDIQFTNQFKKDLKLAKKQNKDLDKLFEVIDILANGGTLEAKYRDHDLTGLIPRTIQKIDLKNRIAIQKVSIRNGRCFSYAQIQERKSLWREIELRVSRSRSVPILPSFRVP